MSLASKQNRESSRSSTQGDSAGAATTVALLAGALTAATASVVDGRAGEFARGTDNATAEPVPGSRQEPASPPTQAVSDGPMPSLHTSEASGRGGQPGGAQQEIAPPDRAEPARGSETVPMGAVEASASSLPPAGQESGPALSQAIAEPSVDGGHEVAKSNGESVRVLDVAGSAPALVSEPGLLDPTVAGAGAALVERLVTEFQSSMHAERIESAVGHISGAVERVVDGVSARIGDTISQFQEWSPGSLAISDAIAHLPGAHLPGLTETGAEDQGTDSLAIDIPITLLGAETNMPSPDGLLAKLFDGADASDPPVSTTSSATGFEAPLAEALANSDSATDMSDDVAFMGDLSTPAADLAPSISLPKLGFAGLSYADADADVPQNGAGHLLQGML